MRLNLETSRLDRSIEMTSFRKLWNTLIDAIKPEMLREQHQHQPADPYAISIDRRPFNVTKGR